MSELSSEDVMILVRDNGVVGVPPDGTMVPIYNLVDHTYIVRIDAVSEFL